MNSHHLARNATDPDAVPASLWKDWLMVLFKLLWDLKATDEALSHAILCALLGCLRRRRKQLVTKGDEEEVLGWGEDVIADKIEALQKAFIPFFCQRTMNRKRRQSAPAKLGVPAIRSVAMCDRHASRMPACVNLARVTTRVSQVVTRMLTAMRSSRRRPTVTYLGLSFTSNRLMCSNER